VSFETLTVAPGLRTVTFGGVSAPTSGVDVADLWLACVADERVA
jgi:hypothetical protein